MTPDLINTLAIPAFAFVALLFGGLVAKAIAGPRRTPVSLIDKRDLTDTVYGKPSSK